MSGRGEGGTESLMLRASDDERQRVADALRDHCAVGRLTVEELDERLDAAYAARTLGDLAALTSDLPPAPSTPAPPSGRLPLAPGLAPFSERISVDRPRGETMAAALDEVAPWLHGYAYKLVHRSDSELRFVYRRRPGWTIAVAIFVFPIGLLALLYQHENEVVIQLAEEEPGRSTITVYGTAPLPVRRTFARLASRRTGLGHGGL